MSENGDRDLPPFARESFVRWFRRRGAVNAGGPPVVLFPATFSNFLHPEPAKAAVEVLESTGHRVVVPEQALCCGRPLYDYGMLDVARAFLRRLIAALAPFVRDGRTSSASSPAASPSFATSSSR